LKRIYIVLAILVFAVTARAQVRPEFEVASVRIVPPGNNSESYMPTIEVRPGATLRIYNRRLDEIIMLAYNIGARQIQGPRWLTEPTTDPSAVTRYEISAKVPADATTEQVPLMLQKLLEDRFKLKVHREEQNVQVYALEVSRDGHKLQTTTASGRPPGCARVVTGGTDIGAAADCSNLTMSQLAQQLQSLAPAYFREGPVVDRTGLSGSFDARLEWMLLQQLEAGMTGPSLYQAVEKLGLTLQKKREAAEILVVDNAEQAPTEN
jgi:uncharacterized protein (TIGR03435 family)